MDLGDLKKKLADLDRLKAKAEQLAGDNTSAGRNRDHARVKSRQRSQAGRDIGPLPPVANPARRQSCAQDFAAFCNAYFPHTFTLAFSDDHQKVIAKITSAVLHADLFAMAMPRGSGKSSLAETAAIWAVLYGHQPFVLLIGAAADNARQMLESIKTELEGNELLLADFPEAVYPIHCLEGEPRRCKGQTFQGQRTLSQWSADKIVLPTIAGSTASGAVIRTVGITGSFRGLKHKLPDGKSLRPSLVIVDDPQTDESAASLTQCQTRERTLAGAVLGLAGPGKKIAGIMPCTVIRDDDLADRILDPDKHPEWNGSRHKLIYRFPDDQQKWTAYKDLLNSYNPDLPGDKERAARAATAFYADNREAMDKGAIVAWPERHNPDELSAVQHCMNLRIRDERAFFAEFQNDPLPEVAGNLPELTADQIAAKLSRLPRRIVPLYATRMTAFIDVQQTVLFYVVCAWADDFTGQVVDYGTWPDQHRAYYTLADIQHNLAHATKVAGVELALEAQLYAGLTELVKQLLEVPWQREDGGESRIDRCLIDANWGQSTDIVYQFCRQSSFAAQLTPSHGKYVGASSLPLTSRKQTKGERLGLNWVIPVATRRVIRHALIDTNFWKSFVAARLALAMGSQGCLSLFGHSADLHQMYADHLTSEYRVRTEGRGRTVDEWKLKPNRDNHWLDCTVGAAVAASIQGVSLESVHKPTKPPRTAKRRSFADMYAQAQAQAKQGDGT